MLRHPLLLRQLALVLVAVLALVLATQQRARSAGGVDWGFEGAGEGWQTTGATFSTGAPSRSGARAGLLSATNTLSMSLRASDVVPPGTSGELTATAWFGGSSVDFRDVAFGVVFLRSNGAEVDGGGQLVTPGGQGWHSATVRADIPADTVGFRVRVIAGPTRVGATLRVDDVEVVLRPPAANATSSAGAGATASGTARTATASPQPTATATVSSATRTPTRTPTPTSTPRATPTPAAATGVFSVVTNGDFEDARPLHGWSAQGGSAGVALAGVTATRSAVLTSVSASTKWLQQAVEVAGGAWYRATATIATRDASDEAFLRIAWYASVDATGSQIDIADSTTVAGITSKVGVGPVQAPLEARSARIRLVLRPSSGLPAVMEADDVELATVPAPAALGAPTPGTPPVIAGAGSAAGALSDGGDISMAAGSLGGRVGTSAPRATVRGATEGVDDARPAAAGNDGLRITELMPDPAESGPDGDFEWVELANLGGEARALEEYMLADNGGSVLLPALVLEPMEVVVVAAGRAALPSTVRAVTLAGGFSNGLGNAGDHLAIVGPGGVVIDGVSWGADRTYAIGRPDLGAPGAGRSIVRRFADDGSFVEAAISAHPSPGSIEDSLAAPGASGVGTGTASVAAASGAGWGDRGWMLLLGVAVVALGIAAAGRVRDAWEMRRLASMR
ncbi:MAG: lamin tail domain-containing protein [Dehalococcoidia bacterium]